MAPFNSEILSLTWVKSLLTLLLISSSIDSTSVFSVLISAIICYNTWPLSESPKLAINSHIWLYLSITPWILSGVYSSSNSKRRLSKCSWIWGRVSFLISRSWTYNSFDNKPSLFCEAISYLSPVSISPSP